MRATLDIADGLTEALMARYPDASETEAIETAIAAHLSDDAAAMLRERRHGLFRRERLAARAGVEAQPRCRTRRAHVAVILADTSVWIEYLRRGEAGWARARRVPCAAPRLGDAARFVSRIGKNRPELADFPRSSTSLGSRQRAGNSGAFETFDRTTENRGVPGSSPGLAIAKSLAAPRFTGFGFVLRAP